MTRQEINRFVNKVCDNEKSFNEVVRVCIEYEKQIEKMKCCGNYKYSRQASAYSIVCEFGGVDKSETENVEDFLVCDKWAFGELANNEG